MKREFFELLKLIAKRSNTELAEFDIKFFMRELGDDWSTNLKGLESFFKKVYGRPRLPSPDEIKQEINPVCASEADIAIDIIGRIYEAIQMYGHSNAAPAILYIGEVGWVAVQRCGGWVNICQANTDQITFIKSQLKACIISMLNLRKDGIANESHSFE